MVPGHSGHLFGANFLSTPDSKKHNQWKLIYQAQFIYFRGQLNFLWDSFRFLHYGAFIYVPPPNGAIFQTSPKAIVKFYECSTCAVNISEGFSLGCTWR
jgi:hypothetical protein